MSNSDSLTDRGRDHSRRYLVVELVAVFLALPILLVFIRTTFRQWIIPTLLLVAAICVRTLWRDSSFDRRRLWSWRQPGCHLRRSLGLFVPGALVLSLLVATLEPDRLLQLPRNRPVLWVVVLILYPALSVYPQELIFRTFFFHRYRQLFVRPRSMIAASAVAFGLAHLFFANWLAPLLGTLGGLLFATTYRRSDSTLQAFLEHSLWGDFVFTVGLGWYFYGGSIVLMAGS